MVGDILAYADYNFVADLLNLPNRAYSYRVISTEHTLENQKEIAQFLDKYLTDRGFEVSGVTAGLVIQEDNSRAINILVVFLLIMALLTAFVGSIGLTGTMGMNVLERTREIGVLRSVGASNGAIRQVVVLEGVMIAVLSWVLVGLVSGPTAAALAGAVMDAVLKTQLTFSYSFAGLFIWLAIIVSIGALSSLTPARNAVRLTVREVLDYE